MNRKLCFSIGMFFWGTVFLFSQISDSLNITIKDTAQVQKDQDFYGRLKSHLKKHKLTKNLVSFFSDSPNQPATSKQIRKELNIDYQTYQGKIIRKINIVTLDPFGYDEKDLSKHPDSKLDRYGNALHIKTKSRTIKKQLLFHENKPMDSLLLKETERILRNQNYIRRVLIRPVAVSAVSDSVDVQVAVLDSWSMFFASDLAGSRGWLRVSEQNLFGLGHEAYMLYRQYFNGFNENGKGFGYRAKNMWNSQINLLTSYYTDYENLYSKQLAIERPMFSPYARWAGRIGYFEERDKKDIYLIDSLYRPPLSTKIFDGYGSYIVPTTQKRPDRINNLIFSLRYQNLKYTELPPDFLNAENYFADQQLYLAKISKNSTGFVQDRYIFRQGDIEDVSVGNSLFLVSGALRKHNAFYPYLGLGFSWAKYSSKGYYSFNLEAGSLFGQNNAKQRVIRGEGIFFSNLFSLNNWHFRQFFKTSFVLGLDRTSHPNDRVSLNERDGILGFYSHVYGSRKLILSSQTQAYNPFYWLGFRFNPFLSIDVGFLGQEKTAFLKTDVYSKFAIGFQISNDFLMFPSFQFAFCYFPRIPRDGTHIFKITNIQNDDFRLQSFQYKPPNMVHYR
ncbi:hypothetical protein [Capnocytophaga sp.]|uniref:hypothetical protein n=1 Tax=Capnocytophaga sp. TaxID=44737 RepID=UPI0026DD6558|nr:hypothetical protein [Capnocytophaga sp.]MDO5105655.1 hypothetical protein [Capnocytophaga sp.]